MADLVATFQENPQFSQNVVIGTGADATELRFVMTYRERSASWYLDTYANDGTPIALGRRLSPGWAPFEGLALTTTVPGLPDEIVFFVQGPSPYVREDLGDTLLFFAFTEDEIAAARTPASGDAVAVTVAP